ncbi:VCBS domain-containing protein [Azospirillum canadense]|uniref:VCBS domain-containing protein n=1 Tax=Azospirillum canadense TaxID=403962 RepID=UPI0022265664|nr:VCBS domain-containing protein [Azospirillum canadense]MCW2242495.1 VCBS repeat-containing protein [Azospirillum canadense]
MDGAAQAAFPAAITTTALALEPRFLFDAAGVATAVEVAHADDHAIPAATPDPHAVDQQLLAGLAAQPAAADAAAQPAAPPATSAPAPAQPAHEVVFVDASVPQYEKLLQGLPPATQVVTIDANRDGLAQIADALKGQQNVTGIHILSHGSAGEISLGNAEISSATLATHTAELDAIKGALAPGADILIYGCDVAQGEQGVAFVNRLAAATGADVAASVDDTGSAALGGNWVLEEHTGAIETSIAVSAAGQEAYQGLMANILPGSAGWTPLMQGTLFDPNNDTQAKAADTDLVGDTAHAVLYGAYDNNGTPDNPNDDFLAFRIRIDNPTSSTEFGGVAVIGIDANQDGRIDLFLAVDGRNNTQAVRILDPGTGLNNSPNTTTTSALPAGWLANNGVYSFTATNYSVAAVSAANDPQWTGNTDLGNDGKTDVFVSFKIPMADIAAVMTKPSATDRNGNVGPRGTTGIAGFTKDTTVSYVLMTETQPGPINGDLGGVGANYDKNLTFAQLGAITGPMTPSNPLAVGQSVTINHTIGDGNLSANEDGAVLLQGKVGSTTADGSWVKVTVTDGASHSVTGYAQVSGGAWQMTKDLSSLNDGTLSVSAELWTTGTGSGSHVTNSVGDSTTVLHDRTPPVIAVDPVLTAGRPTIGGTSDLPVGSTLTVTVDPNGDGILTDAVTYTTTVRNGQVWSIDTAAIAPTTGTIAVAGLTRYATVTASASDTAGNATTVTAITRPTVDALVTISATPTITGTWGGTNGGTDSLSVTVGGVDLTSALVISGKTWSVTIPGDKALVAGQQYEVVAKTTRAGGAIAIDATSSEVAVLAGNSVAIGSNASQTVTTPTISGTTTLAQGSVLTVRLDPNDDGNLSDAVTYAVIVGTNGAWTLNTATATPIAGAMPSDGLNGAVGVLVKGVDPNGQPLSATQTMTITVPVVKISSVGGAIGGTGLAGDFILNGTEDVSVTMTGTSRNLAGQTMSVSVTDGTTTRTASGTVALDGSWSVTFSGAQSLNGLKDGTLTVTAQSSTASATTVLTHDKTPPVIQINVPTLLSNNSQVITGASDLPDGSVINLVITTSVTKAGSTTTKTVNSTATVTKGAWTTPTLTLDAGASVSITASSTATDTAGNPPANATAATAVASNNGFKQPSVTVNTIAGDNIITSPEITAGPITINGAWDSGTNASSGTVTVTITGVSSGVGSGVPAAGQSYTITKTASAVTSTTNGWSVTLTSAEVQSFQNGTLTVKASTTVSSATAEAVALPVVALSNGVGQSVSITSPIGDGNLSKTEGQSVVISGTASNAINQAVTITVSDGTHSVTGSATVAANGQWSTAGLDLSTLNDGTLTVTAALGSKQATASVLYDKTPPVFAITSAASVVVARPSIGGTVTGLSSGTVLTVTVDPNRDGNTVTYLAVVGANGAWSVDTSKAAPSSGTLPETGIPAGASITVSGTDAAGNTTTATAASVTAISDDAGISASDFRTNDTTLVFTGTAAPNAAVQVTLTSAANSTVVFQTSVQANAQGVWTLDRSAAAALGGGTYTLTAATTDSAGNTATATQAVVVDVAPPTVAITGMTDDTGTAGDFISNDTTLLFSGTAEAGSRVTVTLTNAASTQVFRAVVVADANGAWSVDRTGQAALADGAYTLTAVANDAAGNSATATRTVVVDTTATLAITTNYKASSTAPVITGSSDLEAGQSIDVTVNGATYRVQAQSGGGWSLDLASALPTSGTKTALVDGQSYTITATGTDVAGNTATAGKTMLVDVSAPKVAIVSPLDWNGGNSNGVLTLAEDRSVVIKGTTAKGASTTALAGGQIAVTITDGTTTISDTATVQADGSWSLAALNLRGLANGTITVAATYVDSSGVAYTDVATVLHDKSGPVSIDGISTDTGAPGDFVTADQTLVFRGSATAGQPVTVTLTNSGNGTVFSATVTASANGTWSYDNQGNTLPSGTYTLTATSNGTTATQAITVDAVAPAGPVTVASQTTGSVTPTITGTATVGAGETLTVTVNGKTYTAGDGSLTLTGTSWSLTIPAADALAPASTDNGFNGTYSVTATIRDTAGNTLSDATSNELTVTDVTKPVIDLDSVASGVNYAVTSTDGAAVSLDNDGAAATVVEANKLQNLTVTVGGLQNGGSEKLILGRTTVAADGSSGSKLDILVGNVRVNLSYASGVFTITKYDWSSLTAAEAQAVIRDIQYQNALGTGSTAGQRTFAFQTVDQAGNLSDAATATVTVALGSTQTPTTTQTVTITKAVDDVAPRTGDLASGAVTNDTAPELQGTISAALGAGEVVAVYRGGTRLGTATVNGTAWTYTDSTLSNGATYSYTARVENATNQGTASTAFSLTIDTAAPSAPGLALATDSGASGSDRISNVGTVTVSGLETGASWEYTTNGGTNWTAGTGSSFTLAEGGYANGAVKVRQADSAGNLGAEASLGATVIDATAPVVASATVSGTSLVLGYTEANRLDAANRAGTGAFTVKVGGSIVTVSAVSVDATNGTVTLTLGSAVVAGQSVTVSYADPTVGDDTTATQDEAGNDAASFTDRAVTNATGATTPTQTVIITKAVDDVAPKIGDLVTGASTNDTAPELRGTISAALGTGEVLAVYRDGVKIGTATVTGTDWTYTDTGLSNGSTYSYTARVENLVNPGTTSSAFSLTIDTTAPAAPGLALATDSGASGSDRVSNVGTVTVSGLETGASWEYTTNGGTNWTAGTGSSFTLAEGSYASGTVKVRQTDIAGNLGAEASLGATVIDATAPVVASATVSGTSLVLGYTEANRLDAANRAGTGAFTVKVGGSIVTVSAVSVDATNGTVTLTLGSAVVAGQSVTVSYADPTVGDDTTATQDEAGNDAAGFTDRAVTNATGATTPTQTVIITKAVDDVAPKIGDLVTGASTNDTAPELRGTISAALGTGEVLAVYRDGVKIGTATVTGTDWTYTDTGLSNGSTYSYTARVENLVNPGAPSTAFALSIDTTAPGTPAITSATDDAAPVIGTVANGGVTNDTTPALTGTAEPNSTVSVYDGTTLLGTTTANGAGVWTYTPSALNQGTHSFTVTATDAAGNVSGASTAYALTIDAAPTGTDTTISTPEDTPRTLTAADFGFLDADAGDTLVKVKVTQLPSAGTLTLNGTAVVLNQEILRADIDAGKLVFTPAANANGIGYASVAFKVSDGTVYADAASVLSIDVTPVNDAPVATAGSVTMAEDATRVFQASDFGFTDVDGHGLAAVIITSRPAAGTLAYNGTALTAGDVASGFVVAAADLGKLTFTPARDANGTGYASFAFKVQDNGGTANGGQDTSATATLTINVTPVNDAPTGADKTVGTAEDTPYTLAAADFGFADVDAGDALAAVTVTRLPAAGTLTLNGIAVTTDQVISRTDIDAGKLVFTPAADASGTGYASFAFKVSDGALTAATANTITVDVSAVNDAPLAVAQTVAAVEDVERTITLSGTDVDGDALTYRVNRPAAGTLYQVNADGSRGAAITADGTVVTDGAHRVIYVSAPDGNGAGHGTFTFTVADASIVSAPATVTVNVAPVNDAPALTGTKATLAGGTEDTPYVIRKADLLAGFTDVDGDSLSVADLVANHGTLTDNGDGTWTFTPDANYNGPVGLTYSVTDGKGGSVAASNGFTLAAANDAAVIGDPTSAAVIEDANVTNGKLIATGTLSIQDVDAGEGTFRTTVGSDPGNLGSLALQADGTYAYSVDNSAVQFLGAGQTRTDSFTITSFDGTTKRISFTITGVNDAAVIGSADAGTVTEDKDVTAAGQLVTGGTLTIADADAGEASVQPQAGTAGRYGTFTLAADGRWTYAADNAQAAIQQLGAGETLTETFTVKALDNTTHTVTVTIAGANDVPVIGTPTVSSVTEDLNVVNGVLTAAGTIAIGDADQGQAAFQTAVASSAGSLGSLTLQADGRYVYTVDNNAVQFLGTGQTKVDTFIVTAKDGTTRLIAITINGANDAPTFTSTPAGTAYTDTSAPDTFQSFTGTLAARDADGDGVTFGIGGGTVQGGTVAKAGAYGTLTVNSATGAFTFVPDAAAIDALPGGVNPVETFTVTIADGQGGTASQTLTISLTGANETPSVSTTAVSTPTGTPVAQPAAPTVTTPTPVVLSTIEPTRPTTSTSVSQAVASVLSATASTLPRASTDLTAQDTSSSVVAQTAMTRDPGSQSSSPTSLAPSSYRGNSLLPPSVSFVASADTLGGASLITVGAVGDRVVTPGQPNLISVPAGTFQTSDPNAHITLQASLSDGSPLPAWLKFDSSNGTFSGNPPPDLKVTMSIKVIARDDQGAQATTEFRLNIGNNASDETGGAAPRPAAGRGNADGKTPADDSPVPEEQRSAPAESAPAQTTPAGPEPGKRADADPVKAPIGKLAFSRQVNAQAPSGLLAEGEELLRSIQMLLAG